MYMQHNNSLPVPHSFLVWNPICDAGIMYGICVPSDGIEGFLFPPVPGTMWVLNDPFMGLTDGTVTRSRAHTCRLPLLRDDTRLYVNTCGSKIQPPPPQLRLPSALTVYSKHANGECKNALVYSLKIRRKMLQTFGPPWRLNRAEDREDRAGSHGVHSCCSKHC